jgi:phosphohistidine phosphatase
MKTIYVIRHAKSCWDDPSLTDKERPLNSRGKKDAPLIASWMSKKEKFPDIIISSPAVRAFETAQFFAKEFKIKEEEIDIRLPLYHPDVDDLLDVLKTLENHISTVYLFSHNPAITYFANYFGGHMIDNVPTTGVVKLESTVEEWSELGRQNTLRVDFVYPKMKSIAKKNK